MDYSILRSSHGWHKLSAWCYIWHYQYPWEVNRLSWSTNWLPTRIVVSLIVDESVIEMIGMAYRILSEIDILQDNKIRSAGYNAPLIKSGTCGRPSYHIDKDQLLFLLEQGFKVSDISSILGVSNRTIERRMLTFGLKISGN